MTARQPSPARLKRPASKQPGSGSRLKVFEATLGFYDTVVAVPSQAAALRAWGTNQNLFRDGVARATEDDKAREAALAQPGVVLRRAVGTADAFSLAPGLPNIPDLPRSRAKTGEAVPNEPKQADRTALDRAEAALARLEEERRAEQDEFAARHRALAEDEARASTRFAEAETRARDRVQRERKIYLDAGGR